MSKKLAPILLFVYNRSWHAEQTLIALSKNDLANESELFIYADGPKKNCSTEDLNNIKKVRDLIKSKSWCGKVHVIESAVNLGIEASEINAITEKVNEYGRVIVLEDDHVTAPGFLSFINRGLDLYENVPNVYAVNGFVFNIPYPKQKAVLMPMTSAWGWGTWKNKWATFDPEIKQKDFIINNEFLSHRFNLGDFDHTALLNHPDNPWDIRWQYSVFIRHGLCLFPTQSLVRNIGLDGSGTHYTKKSELEDHPLGSSLIDFEIENKIDLEYYGLFLNHFKKEELTLVKRLKSKLNKTNR